MQNKILLLVVLTAIISFSFLIFLSQSQQNIPSTSNSLPTVTNSPISPLSKITLPPPVSTGTISKIKIYMIAIEDNGKSGQKIGCNDSIVPIEKEIKPTTAPLKSALNELLSVKSQFYGNSSQYNSLYQSNLSIESVNIDENKKAIINLSGNIKLGGVCDNPRFEAQLKQTALQFPTVKEVAIFINEKPLNDVLSGK